MMVPLANIVFLVVLALSVGILYGMLEEDGERIVSALLRRPMR